MPMLFLDAVVIVVGFAHAFAAWSYFARSSTERWWLWSLGWVVATVACLIAARADAWAGYGLFAGCVAAWTLWWIAIPASAKLDWLPENRHQATGTIVGQTVTIRNVRNFEWTDKHTFVERWEERVYDLAALQALDLYVCTWGNPRIAHTMVSFDFADRPPLCLSVETRREVKERWTVFAGLMKSYELVIIAGDERDLVKSRIALRGEDVRLYRIASTPGMRRKILALSIAQMNCLAARPRFYNTIFYNCTTEIGRIVWAAGHRFPLNWRLFLTGFVAEYLYDLALLDRSRSFCALKENADIRARAGSIGGDDPEFSRRIRAGLADPNLVSLSATQTTPTPP